MNGSLSCCCVRSASARVCISIMSPQHVKDLVGRHDHRRTHACPDPGSLPRSAVRLCWLWVCIHRACNPPAVAFNVSRQVRHPRAVACQAAC